VTCQYDTIVLSIGQVDFPFENKLMLLPDPDSSFMTGRVKHVRIYWKAITDPQTVIYDRFFDLLHT